MEQPGRHSDEWQRPDSERDEDFLPGDPELTPQQKIGMLVFQSNLDKQHPVEAIADIPLRYARMLKAKERVYRRLREQGIEPYDLK